MTDPAEALAELEQTLAAALDFRRFNKFQFFTPYPKQLDFLDLGIGKKERLLMAGNQLGKTYTGAYEMALHLTGRYPDDWMGYRFTKPGIRAWACGESSLVVRDVQQKLLCGTAGVASDFGTGMIPRADFVDTPSLARGVTDAYDMIQVQHHDATGKPDGISVLNFKSYEQGRTKFQGDSIDFLWMDEEPGEDIYSEALTRTVATKGIAIMTFTPLKGMSKVVRRFLSEGGPDRGVVTMTIEDAAHFTAEERAATIARYPEHERSARAMGVPMMGSGLIYQVASASIMEEPIQHIPDYWVKLWGIDFGIALDHPFAAVLILWDRDNDVIHVHHVIRIVGLLPPGHAKAMRQLGANVPVAWPHDGNNRDKGSGEPLSKLYRAEKLRMVGTHSTWPDGGYEVEPGIMEIHERMQSGRFRVAKQLSEWFEEQRMYHRKDGLIVKAYDDIMDATRIAVMMKREAKAVQLGTGDWTQFRKRGGGQRMAQGIDFDLD